MGVIWYKIWFDIWHNKTRTVLAVLSIAAGVFAIGAIFGMSQMLISNMDTSHRAVLPTHINAGLQEYVDREVLLGLFQTSSHELGHLGEVHFARHSAQFERRVAELIGLFEDLFPAPGRAAQGGERNRIPFGRSGPQNGRRGGEAGSHCRQKCPSGGAHGA